MKARYKRAAALFLVVCLLLTSNVNSFYEYNGLNTDKTDFVSGFKFHDEPDSNIQSDKSNCCEDVMLIDSSIHPDGYLKAPQIYEEMNEPKNANKIIECIYKFYGKPGERVQLFYEDFDLFYPYDIYKFNKIDCRYSDSICLKFYENSESVIDQGSLSKLPKFSQLNSPVALPVENHNYDLCNCINVTYTPRQIMSASNFIQVRFRTVKRSFDSDDDTLHSKKHFRGYLIRYKFTRDFGLDVKESGDLDRTGSCKLSFHSANRRSGYFASPNYPGLYPRDIECHYYFMGQEHEKVQITFHTFDVEGVEQCKSETKSDFVELSNFQNRDRFFSRYCGLNKPSSIQSDGRFFHITFYSNNVFDAKGFQASYYFINNPKESHKKSAPNTGEKNLASAVVTGLAIRNRSNQILASIINLFIFTKIYFTFFYFSKFLY